MTPFLSSLKYKKLKRLHLAEKFPLQSKLSAKYRYPLKGIDLTEEQAFKTLEEFADTKNPIMYLHIPKDNFEEFREYFLQNVDKEMFRIQNISNDTTCESFLRDYFPVRFSFRNNNFHFFFETDVLGKLEKESHFLVKNPDVIYQERRSHQRYQLWPTYEVLFNGMQVADISQKGLSFYSGDNLDQQHIIENGMLEFCSICSSDNEICFFEGGQILVPQTMIANYTRKKGIYCYGAYFSKEWPEEGIKILNDFLLAVRKRLKEEPY